MRPHAVAHQDVQQLAIVYAPLIVSAMQASCRTRVALGHRPSSAGKTGDHEDFITPRHTKGANVTKVLSIGSFLSLIFFSSRHVPTARRH